METLKKDMEEDDAVSMLVVGTEAGQVLVLEPSGTAVQVNVQLPSAPAFLACTGLYAVEYRIVAACRDGHVPMTRLLLEQRATSLDPPPAVPPAAQVSAERRPGRREGGACLANISDVSVHTQQHPKQNLGNLVP